MSTNLIKVSIMPYDGSLLEDWIKYRSRKRYAFLRNSDASPFIKRILQHKGDERKEKKWFFGESYVASRIEMDSGWFSSYKWLWAKRWVTGRIPKSDKDYKFKKKIYRMLMEKIGKEQIENLQICTEKLITNHRKKLLNEKGKLKKPGAPDLWIIDNNGRFRFIEVKLAEKPSGVKRDDAKTHQYAGLALIKKHIKIKNPLTVEIVELYDSQAMPSMAQKRIIVDTHKKEFLKFYKIV